MRVEDGGGGEGGTSAVPRGPADPEVADADVTPLGPDRAPLAQGQASYLFRRPFLSFCFFLSQVIYYLFLKAFFHLSPRQGCKAAEDHLHPKG